jgi:hypothetical protein
MVDEDGNGFDPTLVLPNGYRLLVGTLLRLIHERSNKPSQVREIIEGAYTTLYLAETDEHAMRGRVEEIMVEKFTRNLDKELKQLLGGDNGNDDEG